MVENIEKNLKYMDNIYYDKMQEQYLDMVKSVLVSNVIDL